MFELNEHRELKSLTCVNFGSLSFGKFRHNGEDFVDLSIIAKSVSHMRPKTYPNVPPARASGSPAILRLRDAPFAVIGLFVAERNILTQLAGYAFNNRQAEQNCSHCIF